MIQTFEALTDAEGNIRLIQPVRLPAGRRVLVTVLTEESAMSKSETALLSEASLAEDWDRPEEEEAWLHLQQVQSS
jgi:hypothetical protein